MATTYQLTFFSVSDVDATLFGGPADLTQEWVYNNTFSDITFNSESVLTVTDDDADPNFNDDDDVSWKAGFSGDYSNKQVAVSGPGVTPGAYIAPENTYEFVDSSGDTYTMLIVQEVGTEGNGLGIVGYVFQGNPPPVGVTLYPTSSTYSDLPSIPYSSLAAVCFVEGALILTEQGEKRVQDLNVGDLVVTKDHGLQAIRWIGSKRLDAGTLRIAPNLYPVRIKRHALGENMPTRDLLVSPQHRVLVRSRIADRMFGEPEVLVAAKQLCQIDGVDIEHEMKEVRYFHFLFEQHEIVFSNGAETESLYTGPHAMKSLSAESRNEVLRIFPEIVDIKYEARPARMLSSGRRGRQLAIRHQKNHKPLVLAEM